MDKCIITFGILFLTLVTMNSGVKSQSRVNFTMLHTAVSKGAVCLDGSPPTYAHFEGFGNGSKSWIIFLQGGGWCMSKEDCLKRSKMDLGSSYYSTTNSTIFSGILDSDAKFNPYFYNWHKVYIHYCDGSSFMSDVEEVDPSTNLHFRGARIYNAMMEEMLNKGLCEAENAILSGSSAGGLATILHCDEFRQLLPIESRVKCISDSGFFIRGKGKLANITERHFAKVIAANGLADLLPASCTSKRDPNLCLFPEYLVADVTTPLFLIEMAFDTYQIGSHFIFATDYGRPSQWNDCLSHLALCNSTQIQITKEFRPLFIETLVKLNKPSCGGLFVDTCFGHTQFLRRSLWMCSPLLKNKTMGQAVAEWYLDGSSFQEIDTLNTLPRNCSDPPENTCLAP